VQVKRILLVDDDEHSRQSLKQILAEDGYDVTTCADGAEVLGVMEHSEFDVLITDLKMPKMNGIELLEKVKETKPDIHTIIITAFGETDTYLKAMNVGAADYLNKPIDYTELTRILKALESK
jgi:DNA-binding NtrC family response regulator